MKRDTTTCRECGQARDLGERMESVLRTHEDRLSLARERTEFEKDAASKLLGRLQKVETERDALLAELADAYPIAEAARDLHEAASQLKTIKDPEAAILIHRLSEVIVRIRCSTPAAKLEYLPPRLREVRV